MHFWPDLIDFNDEQAEIQQFLHSLAIWIGTYEETRFQWVETVETKEAGGGARPAR